MGRSENCQNLQPLWTGPNCLVKEHSPGNKRVSRLFPVTSDGANAVPCSEVIYILEVG